MKVVLFCGGKGLRMQEASRRIPKPMITIGGRPVLWHVMKYYAHFGHTDFILCLGHKQEVIKDYFLNYNEASSNDFIIRNGGDEIELLSEDISKWTITFVNTGYSANVGERLRRVRKHLAGEEYFLANYGDVLTDAPLDRIIDHVTSAERTAGFISVPPSYTFHTVHVGEGNLVERITSCTEADIWVNGGYFVLNTRIFDDMSPGDELVTDVFSRLIVRRELVTWRHEGFWAPMDTLKEQQELEAMVEAGGGPWRVWRTEDEFA